jgi:hypothetical protein
MTTDETSGQVLPTIMITRTLLDQTARLLASFAELRDAEGVVYWFGLELGTSSVVTTLVVPNTAPELACVFTTAAANAEAMSVIVDTPLVLIGQAHSHPRGLVGHSRVDDRETFAQFPSALSVVVPFYGRRGADLDRCGVHRHIDGRYVQIANNQIRDHLRVVPGFVDFRRT